MKLIKLILWAAVTLVIAYFLTDLRIGGKTIKQTIDEKIGSFFPGYAETKDRILGIKHDEEIKEIVSGIKEPPKEEITDDDAQKLNNLLKENE